MNGIIVLLLVIINLITTTEGECDMVDTVKCRSRLGKEHVQLADGRSLSCAYKATEGITHSHQTEKTGPPVEKHSLHLVTYKHRGKKALEISWLQKEHHLRHNIVSGYSLSIQQSYYNITLDKSKEKNGIKGTNSCIRFVLRNYGRKSQTLRPGDKIEVSVYPLPQAHNKNGFNDESATITIKAKKKSKRQKKYKGPKTFIVTKQLNNLTAEVAPLAVVSSIHERMTTQRIIYVNTEATSQTTDSNEMFIGAAIACFFVILLVVTGFLIMKKAQKEQNGGHEGSKENLLSRNILMISDNLSDNLMYEVHCLAEFLIEDQHFKVICNWKCREAIAQNQMSWYEENMNKAEVIVFVTSTPFTENTFLCHNGKESQNYSDEFWKAKNCAKRHKWNNPLKDIILLTNQVENSPNAGKSYYSVYSLKTKYSHDDNFYKHLLGFNTHFENGEKSVYQGGARPKIRKYPLNNNAELI